MKNNLTNCVHFDVTFLFFVETLALCVICSSDFVQGVLEAVRISLAGYPTRKTYHEFVDRFGIIALDIMDMG